MVFVSIDQLPKNRQTLVLRILGRGETQKRAIAEVLALSSDEPLRLPRLRVLGNWKVTLELAQVALEDQESIMAFSQAFLKWEQATSQEGIQQGLEPGLEPGLEQGLEQGLEHERSLILRQLTRKISTLSPEATARIQSLTLEQVEALGEALLDFNQPDDLQAWLEQG